jgi:hypothetical protein
MSLLDYLAARGREPSTYAGLGLLLGVLGLHPSDPQLQAIIQGLEALAGLVSVFSAERGSSS